MIWTLIDVVIAPRPYERDNDNGWSPTISVNVLSNRNFELWIGIQTFLRSPNQIPRGNCQNSAGFCCLWWWLTVRCSGCGVSVWYSAFWQPNDAVYSLSRSLRLVKRSGTLILLHTYTPCLSLLACIVTGGGAPEHTSSNSHTIVTTSSVVSDTLPPADVPSLPPKPGNLQHQKQCL